MPTIESHFFIACFLNTAMTGCSLDAFAELLDFHSPRLV
jgi:hypothetical protein